jgi:hypothetical protein
MKLKKETGEMLVLDDEAQTWVAESVESDTSITVSEAEELLEKGELEMVAEDSEISADEAESLDEAEAPKAKALSKKKKSEEGSGNVEVFEGEEEDGDEADEDEEDEVEEDSKATVKKEEVELVVDVTEDVNALFDGQELTEDFKQRTTLVFETAVKAKVKENLAAIEESMEAKLAEQTEAMLGELTAKLDGYLDYMVQEWVEDNKVAVENGLKNEILEGFVGGLQTLFAEHYIEIPEEKYNVVDEQAKEIEGLKEQLDTEMTKNIEVKTALAEMTAEKIFGDVVEGLTMTQTEKLKTLAEGVEFENAETYAEKLNTLKETYFPSEAEKEEVIAESTEDTATAAGEEVKLDDTMSRYVSSLSNSREKSIFGA